MVCTKLGVVEGKIREMRKRGKMGADVKARNVFPMLR